ncbi:hypothetical protein ACTXN8_03235 [Pseudomonas helleri]|uniref:hypothetical protein n=1 Tax=Pseudomonas helleri TaxID=1608996 RepID=UPI003FD50C48
MAIKNTVTFKGLVVDKAYIRVLMPTISPGNTRFEFVTHTMVSPESEALTATGYEAPYSLTGANPLEQAYEHLKTLPEFEGCTDC